MPQYEYECHRCGDRFEFWSRLNQLTGEIRCPVCGDRSPERIIRVTEPQYEDPATVGESC